MPYNVHDAERRRRTQQVTGKVGGGSAHALGYNAYPSLQQDDAHSIAAAQRRGNLTSLGAFVNQEGVDAESSKHRPHRSSSPVAAYNAYQSPGGLRPPHAPSPTGREYPGNARRSETVSSVLAPGTAPSAGPPGQHPPAPEAAVSRLSTDRDFAGLMQLVFANHSEGTRSYLDFKPDAPPY